MQLYGFSAYPDGSSSQLIRITGVVLFACRTGPYNSHYTDQFCTYISCECYDIHCSWWYKVLSVFFCTEHPVVL